MTDNLAFSQKVRNTLIALGAIALSITLFFAVTQQNSSHSLEQQAAAAMPLNDALANQKPTLIEFYANWCTSCQAMAGDLETLKASHPEDVNFVMLNVDNPNWLPEVLRYDVDGIPHLVYLDGDGQTVAQAVGEQPLSILKADVDALVMGQALPYAESVGASSEFSTAAPDRATDPRSHGAFAS